MNRKDLQAELAHLRDMRRFIHPTEYRLARRNLLAVLLWRRQGLTMPKGDAKC